MTASTRAAMRLAALGWTEPPWWRPFKRRAWRLCVKEWRSAVWSEVAASVLASVAAQAIAGAVGAGGVKADRTEVN